MNTGYNPTEESKVALAKAKALEELLTNVFYESGAEEQLSDEDRVKLKLLEDIVREYKIFSEMLAGVQDEEDPSESKGPEESEVWDLYSDDEENDDMDTSDVD